jgi:hypothetical protein
MPRYALLRHTGAPDDPNGYHYDLLLEDGEHCRTWRLTHRPVVGEAAQAAVELAPHRLVWLTPRSAAVSGGRGWAEGVAHGSYAGVLPSEAQAPVIVQLLDGALTGWLRLQDGCCVLEKRAIPTGTAP